MLSISREMANKAVEISKDRKGIDITLLDIHEISPIADYFVIVTGTSNTHIQGISDALEEKMDLAGYKLHHKEGFRGGRWILQDYGNIIIHIFHDEERKFYSIERLWIDAKPVDIE